MSVKIRLARGGAKKSPYYRIVVADARSPRDGNFIEKIGSYNPLLAKDNDKRVQIDAERAKHWLSVGAQPSERVEKFLAKAGLVEARDYSEKPQKTRKDPNKQNKAEQRAAAEEEARNNPPAVEEAPVAEAAAEEAPAVEEAPAAEAAEETPAE